MNDSGKQFDTAERTGLSRRRRRRSGYSSLFANGESMIWATGGALVICLIMILGLLGLVAYQGMMTFWPQPVVELQTKAGTHHLGEIFSIEDAQPTRDIMDPRTRTTRSRVIETQAYQLRTGNFEMSGDHFDMLYGDQLAGPPRHPTWATVVERWRGGRFYGIPKAYLLIDQTPAETPMELRTVLQQMGMTERHPEPDARMVVIERYAKAHQRTIPLLIEPEQLQDGDNILGVAQCWIDPAHAWQAYRHFAPQVRAMHAQRDALNRERAGQIRNRVERARLELREAELKYQPARSWVQAYQHALKARRTGDEQAIEAAEQRLERLLQQVPLPQPEMIEAMETFDRIDRQALEEMTEINELLAEQKRALDRHRFLFDTTSGPVMLQTAQIVHAYPPNNINFAAKLGIYGSRWYEYLTAEPRSQNMEGGVWPQIMGTVLLTIIMAIFGIPFGVLAALYLREYARAGLAISMVRIAINNLAGVPSIVFGVFGLGFFCYIVGGYIDAGPEGAQITPLPPGRWYAMLGLLALMAIAAFALTLLSMMRTDATGTRRSSPWITILSGGLWMASTGLGLYVIFTTPYFGGFFQERQPDPTFGTGGILWAALTLALLTLPVVIVATEEAIAAVPHSMREGSYACGASKWQTIQRIVLPHAMPGVLTGTILAMARGAGEVAPLMLVGAVKIAPDLPIDQEFPYMHLDRSFLHLGFHIYDLSLQSPNSEAATPMVYTTTLLLIMIVVTLNLAAIALRGRLKKRFNVDKV